jgi:serine/threonine-protein kinase
VVHRDVSPHNIILSYDGTVKLLDFGVATSSVTEHEETMIVGKWRYMSPETTTNQQIDHRSDLFSLGVILYLLCSGHMPFTGRETKEIVKKIRGGQYKPLQQIVQVPERLAVLVGRLLSHDPDDRPQDGQAVAAELTEIARQYGMESSGPRVAGLLAQLFPSEDSGAPEQDAGKDIVRVILDEMGSLTAKEKSPGSVTPDSSSTSGRGVLAVDISETYRWRSRDVSATLLGVAPAVPAAQLSGSASVPAQLSGSASVQPSSPGTARSSSPGIARSSSPGIARSSSPGIARSSSPGIARSSSPGIARSSSSSIPRTPSRPSAPQRRGPSLVTISIAAALVAALAIAMYLFVLS